MRDALYTPLRVMPSEVVHKITHPVFLPPFSPPFFFGEKTASNFGAAPTRVADGCGPCLAPGVFSSRFWALIMARRRVGVSAHALLSGWLAVAPTTPGEHEEARLPFRHY